MVPGNLAVAGYTQVPTIWRCDKQNFGWYWREVLDSQK